MVFIRLEQVHDRSLEVVLPHGNQRYTDKESLGRNAPRGRVLWWRQGEGIFATDSTI
jgi:hypothetical protein